MMASRVGYCAQSGSDMLFSLCLVHRLVLCGCIACYRLGAVEFPVSGREEA